MGGIHMKNSDKKADEKQERIQPAKPAKKKKGCGCGKRSR
jgi:hypothetical protein